MLDRLRLLKLSTQPVAPFCCLAAFIFLLSAIVLPLNGWPTLAAPTESSSWENWDEKAGYSLLNEDGTPKPACEALRAAFSSANLEPSGPSQGQSLLFPASSPIFILARDEEVHLGDSE
jgi:hypothetical protein